MNYESRELRRALKTVMAVTLLALIYLWIKR
jgi:hypothetical protein